jgi:hypothetical protein
MEPAAMMTPSTRIFLGCVAGAVSVLLFHQTTLQILFWLGLAPMAAFRVAHVAPFNMPMVVSITFWGAVYGGIFAALTSRLRKPLWWFGWPLGICAMLIGWFVFQPLKGQPIAFGGQTGPMLRTFLAYSLWGIGVTLILPLLHPRSRGAGRPPFVPQTFAN